LAPPLPTRCRVADLQIEYLVGRELLAIASKIGGNGKTRELLCCVRSDPVTRSQDKWARLKLYLTRCVQGVMARASGAKDTSSRTLPWAEILCAAGWRTVARCIL
jgi:hypothetical protein